MGLSATQHVSLALEISHTQGRGCCQNTALQHFLSTSREGKRFPGDKEPGLEKLPGPLELQAPPRRMSHHLIPHCCSQQPQLPALPLKHKQGDVTAAACSELPEHDANVAFEVRKTKQDTERTTGICREEGLALLKASVACWEQLLQTNTGPQTPPLSAGKDGKSFLAIL